MDEEEKLARLTQQLAADRVHRRMERITMENGQMLFHTREMTDDGLQGGDIMVQVGETKLMCNVEPEHRAATYERLKKILHGQHGEHLPAGMSIHYDPVRATEIERQAGRDAEGLETSFQQMQLGTSAPRSQLKTPGMAKPQTEAMPDEDMFGGKAAEKQKMKKKLAKAFAEL